MEALHSFKVTGCHDNNEAKTIPLPVLREPRNPKQTGRTTSTPPGGAGSCGRVDVSKTSIAVLLLAAALLGCATPTVSRDYKLAAGARTGLRSEEHTSELQSQSNLVCRLLLEKKKKTL